MPLWKTTWSPAAAAKDSFGRSAAFSGSGSYTVEGPRHNVIPSTWQATAIWERTVSYRCFCAMISYVISYMISHMISCCEQDCVVLLAPYPNNPNPVESFNVKTEFDLQGDCLVWYVRPRLFFNCTLCPIGAKGPGYRASHREESLMYFSTFEPIDLTPDSIMQQAGVSISYD
jgi:hypothetical protein